MFSPKILSKVLPLLLLLSMPLQVRAKEGKTTYAESSHHPKKISQAIDKKKEEIEGWRDYLWWGAVPIAGLLGILTIKTISLYKKNAKRKRKEFSKALKKSNKERMIEKRKKMGEKYMELYKKKTEKYQEYKKLEEQRYKKFQEYSKSEPRNEKILDEHSALYKKRTEKYKEYKRLEEECAKMHKEYQELYRRT